MGKADRSSKIPKSHVILKGNKEADMVSKTKSRTKPDQHIAKQKSTPQKRNT